MDWLDSDDVVVLGEVEATVVVPAELDEELEEAVVVDDGPGPLRAKYAPAPATATTTIRTIAKVAAAMPRRDLELG